MFSIIGRPGWVPEEASWPNLLEVCWIRFKEKLGLQIMEGPTLIALNAGLMKPQKGFTTVGQQKLG